MLVRTEMAVINKVLLVKIEIALATQGFKIVDITNKFVRIRLKMMLVFENTPKQILYLA